MRERDVVKICVVVNERVATTPAQALASTRLMEAAARTLAPLRSWMANVGVNVLVPEVIGYMGSLYAENIVLAEWMLDPDKVGVALSRTWMYQEMAFGPLDREAMGVLFERLRGLGRAVGEIALERSELFFFQ